MLLQQRINAFASLGKFLGQFSTSEIHRDDTIPENSRFFDSMLHSIESAKIHNGWFTKESLYYAFKSWSVALSEENLKKWVEKYEIPNNNPKTIGVVMAGNIPLVGFHDFISVLITGNKVLAKLSSKDNQLLPLIAEYLTTIEPDFTGLIDFSDGRLDNFDAVIATGSNNTAKYFEYYFGKYPSILRKNRNSIAILNGAETSEEMEALADDIFRYFGLGCRNVSKIFVPEEYSFEAFFKGMYSWKHIINNTKYINNYDYNKAVYLMSNVELLDNEFLLLKEDENYSSPIGVLFFERYKSLDVIQQKIDRDKMEIQCVVSNLDWANFIPFGQAQSPDLWDYADNVDTVDFLLKLSE